MISGLAQATDPKSVQDPWEPLRPLFGEWTGTGTGMGGDAEVEHVYGGILQEKFVRMTTRSSFPPQENNPDGELHEDLGIFSYDSVRGKIVLRQFLTEGYVNQYVLMSVSEDGKTLVFTTESVEAGR